jgi:hypothetical protein
MCDKSHNRTESSPGNLQKFELKYFTEKKREKPYFGSDSQKKKKRKKPYFEIDSQNIFILSILFYNKYLKSF